MDDLLERQAALQGQADRLVAELALEEQLGVFGVPVRVGSSALRLMVRRDIDITVICPKLDGDVLAGLAALGTRLLIESGRVWAMQVRNDSGEWNREPEAYPDGLYLKLNARDGDGAEWTFDIWLVDEPERQPDLRHLQTLPPRLTDDARRRILAIKRELAERPDHDRGPSAEVYDAVLDGGVATLQDFDAWRTARAK